MGPPLPRSSTDGLRDVQGGVNKLSRTAPTKTAPASPTSPASASMSVIGIVAAVIAMVAVGTIMWQNRNPAAGFLLSEESAATTSSSPNAELAVPDKGRRGRCPLTVVAQDRLRDVIVKDVTGGGRNSSPDVAGLRLAAAYSGASSGGGVAPVRVIINATSDEFETLRQSVVAALSSTLCEARLTHADAGTSIAALKAAALTAIRGRRCCCLFWSIPDLSQWSAESAGALKAVMEGGDLQGEAVVPCQLLLLARFPGGTSAAAVATSRHYRDAMRAALPLVPDRVLHMLEWRTLHG